MSYFLIKLCWRIFPVSFFLISITHSINMKKASLQLILAPIYSRHSGPNTPKRPYIETSCELCNRNYIWYLSLFYQNGRRIADDIFRCIYMNEKCCILIKISLNFVPIASINNILALVQIMAWRRIGDKPLYETMLTRFNDAYMRH